MYTNFLLVLGDLFFHPSLQYSLQLMGNVDFTASQSSDIELLKTQYIHLEQHHN
jgi:hypothetical protein